MPPDPSFDLTDSNHVHYVAEFEIEREDVFHLKNLYKLIHEWFMMNGFVSIDSNDDKVETLYFQRILDNGNSEHHIWWRLHKIPGGNNYYKYYVRFDFQTLNMGKGEVVVKGKKVKTNSGDVIMRCKTYVILDYKQEWRKHPILKTFHGWWRRYFYKKHFDFIKTDLWVTTYKLQDVIKQYLNLKNPYEMQKPFNPEGGV